MPSSGRQVFYGREQELDRIQRYVCGEGEGDKPLVLYGEGGCGKTSLLAMSAGSSSAEWFPGARPLCVIRFLGTTPDSSALTPTLISICQQISYNFMLPYEDIPDDLVPLTAHFKHLLTCATKEQPLIVFLDSVDQLTGAQDANKVSWLPTRLPSNCKVAQEFQTTLRVTSARCCQCVNNDVPLQLIVSCAAEADNPEVSREYHLLRRMLDGEEHFIEVTALGEDLAMQVIK